MAIPTKFLLPRFETVQLLCGQCFGDCHKQQPYVAVVAIFKIALVVIF